MLDEIKCVGARFIDVIGEVVMRRLGLIVGAGVVAIVLILGVWIFSRPERGTTGSVSTRFRLLGPNDKIVVDGFDDPKVEGVATSAGRRPGA